MRTTSKYLVGLLVLSLAALGLKSRIDNDEQLRRAQDTSDENNSILRSASHQLDANRQAFARDKISYLVGIEKRGLSSEPYSALLDGFMLNSADPDLSNALRTIAEKIRPEVNILAGSLAREIICAAAIGAVLGRDPKTIELDRVESDIAYVSHLRESDRTRWKQKCRVAGIHVEWGDAQGRWQNSPADSKLVVSWSAEGIQITQIHPDQSKTLSTWNWAVFR